MTTDSNPPTGTIPNPAVAAHPTRPYQKLMHGLLLLTLMTGCAMQSGVTQTDIAADIPWSSKPFANDPDNFQFVIIGDRTGGHRPGVFPRAMARINELQPEFVVGVGDLIEGYTEDLEKLNAEWDEFDALIDNLDMPFFYTAGNHDISNDVMRQLWLARNGRDYYSFRYKNVLFISLNTEDPPIQLPPEIQARQLQLEAMMLKDPEGTQQMILERAAERGPNQVTLPGSVAISDEQVAWVSSTLEDNRDVRWTVVLMHKPAWDYDHPGFKKIEAQLANRPHTVIAGHEHYYHYSQRGGADYITMATTGGVWLSASGGAFDHIAWVTMTDNGPKISNIALCGLLGTPEQTVSAFEDKTGKQCFNPDD